MSLYFLENFVVNSVSIDQAIWCHQKEGSQCGLWIARIQDHCVFFCAKRVSLSLDYICSTSVGSENFFVTLKVIEKDFIFIGYIWKKQIQRLNEGEHGDAVKTTLAFSLRAKLCSQPCCGHHPDLYPSKLTFCSGWLMYALVWMDSLLQC